MISATQPWATIKPTGRKGWFRSGVDLVSGSRRIFTPTQLPNLALWLDASDVSTFTLDGTSIYAWRDKSGNNNHATTAATNVRRYDPSVVNQNGYGVVRYDGTSGHLTLATRLTTVRSVFMAMKWTATTGDYRFLFGDSSAYDWHGDTAANNKLFSSSASTSIKGGSGYVNGTSTSPVSMVRGTSWHQLGFVTTGNVIIGNISKDRNEAGARYLYGDVGEIIVMTAAATTEQRLDVELYLRRKWGLP